MTNINISLPETLRSFGDAQVQPRGYATFDEYVCDLIRRDQIKQGEDRLAMLMLEGLTSGAGIPVDEKYWVRKREELKSTNNGI